MNIAILDDDPTIRMAVEAVLRNSGSIMTWDMVDTFATADDFLQTFYGRPLDWYGVIICDHDLGKNQPKGYDLLCVICNDGYNGDPILLTGDNSSSMALKMDSISTIHYVVKKFAKGEENAYNVLSSLIGKARG